MTPHRDPTAPASASALPALAAGAHLAPEDGVCLMEYVSILAGRPFTDHPNCTDPLLATLARLVNDACTDGGRDRLLPLAAALARTPPADAIGSARLVLAVVAAASTASDAGRRLWRHERAARRRLRRITATGPLAALARRLDVAHRHGGGRRRLEAAVRAVLELPEAERDAALCTLLAAAMSSLRPAAAAGGIRRAEAVRA